MRACMDHQWRAAEATADTERSLDLAVKCLSLMTPGRQAIRGVATIVEETDCSAPTIGLRRS